MVSDIISLKTLLSEHRTVLLKFYKFKFAFKFAFKSVNW